MNVLGTYELILSYTVAVIRFILYIFGVRRISKPGEILTKESFVRKSNNRFRI